MTDFQYSMPISKRIHAAFAAILVTAIVICVFPLLESLAAVQPAQKTLPAAVPVKIASVNPQPSMSLPSHAKPTTSPKSMKMAAMALPKPLLPPPKTPVVQLPPKSLPSPVKPVDIPPQPSVQPNVTIPPVQPQPIAEIIPQHTEATPLETTASTATDANSTTESSLLGTDDGALPDGKSLKIPPIFMKHILPTYPEYARRRGLEGFVILQFIVDINGRVVEPSVQEANPQGYFETAAIRAIKQWRFSPGRNDKGTPVPCRLQMRIDFRLKNSTNYGYQIRLQ